MSLQDDIFDIRDALKDTPEAKAFARVEEALSRYEGAFHRAHEQLTDIQKGAKAFFALVKET